MAFADIVQRSRAGASRLFQLALQGARAAGVLAVRGGRATGRLAVRAWRSPLRRRLVRPLLVSTRVVLVSALLSGLLILSGGACVRRVPPTDHVVRQVNWGAEAGVAPEDLGPGFHLGTPGRTAWHVLDARTVFLRFGPHAEGNPFPPLELRTSDDVELSLSVSVPFRIQDGAAHRVVADGLKSTYKQNAKTAVEKVLAERFPLLPSQAWFDTDVRLAASAEALTAINEALDRLHLEAEAVLVTSATFPGLYEEKLADQKLTGQRLQTAEVLARRDLQKHEMDVEQAALLRAEQELSATFELRMEEQRLEREDRILAVTQAADTYRFELRTEADNVYAKAAAEGQLAIDQANAHREKLMNEALESEGGRLLLAQDAAASIRFRRVRLDSNNPSVPSVFDLDGLVRMLVGEGGAGR